MADDNSSATDAVLSIEDERLILDFAYGAISSIAAVTYLWPLEKRRLLWKTIVTHALGHAEKYGVGLPNG